MRQYMKAQDNIKRRRRLEQKEEEFVTIAQRLVYKDKGKMKKINVKTFPNTIEDRTQQQKRDFIKQSADRKDSYQKQKKSRNDYLQNPQSVSLNISTSVSKGKTPDLNAIEGPRRGETIRTIRKEKSPHVELKLPRIDSYSSMQKHRTVLQTPLDTTANDHDDSSSFKLEQVVNIPNEDFVD